MKSRVFVERQFRKTAEEVTDEIDCRQCAECCRVTEVQIVERDIKTLAHFLGLSEKAFLDKHTDRDEDNALILRRNAQGCEFLEGNDCTVYEARPGNCERFPHLMKGAGSLESRMWALVDRATYCPIVYNWMEKVESPHQFKPSSGG